MAVSLDYPKTYSQWSDCLERLSRGLEDEACLEDMARGELLWEGGVATLFANRLGSEFNARLTLCSERLTRDLQCFGDESTLIRAILNARQALNFLYRLANTPAFPEKIQIYWTEEVRKFSEHAQLSLENSARADRSGRLTVLFRNNHLGRYEQIQPVLGLLQASPFSEIPNAVADNGTRKKRNILI